MRAGLVVCLMMVAGCRVYERRDVVEDRSVELGQTESARFNIDLGAGELRLGGGAAKLLEAHFDYNIPEWKPELKYAVSLGRGDLTLRQPPARGFPGGDTRNRWDLRVNDKIPLELRVHMGAGQGVLRLAGLLVRRLEIEMGAGDLDLDLNGPWQQDFSGYIRGGVGHAQVRLPHEAGVRVRATGGLGGISAHNLRQDGDYYVNDAYGKAPVRIRLDISGGIGQIDLIG